MGCSFSLGVFVKLLFAVAVCTIVAFVVLCVHFFPSSQLKQIHVVYEFIFVLILYDLQTYFYKIVIILPLQFYFTLLI